MSTSTHKPFAGRALHPSDLAFAGKLSRRERREFLRHMRALGAVVPIGGGQTPAMVADSDPFGVTIDADGRVVVDDFTNPISNIPAVVREFARGSEGYWIEDVFNSPGWTVQGGAVRYSISRPADHFLPAGQTLRPRAPGAEAPRVSGTRRRPIVAYPESISASIEVHDETRQRNDVIAVQTTFRQTANTFTETFQDLGEAALDALVTASSRFVLTAGAGGISDWAAAPRQEKYDYTGAFPAEEFDVVQETLVVERGGVQLDTLVWHPTDRRHFNRVYRGDGPDVLAAAGIRQTFTTVRRTAGRRLYLRAGQVGTMAWELPLGDPEYVREGIRKTDVYVLEGRVVFVANGADAILEMRKA